MKMIYSTINMIKSKKKKKYFETAYTFKVIEKNDCNNLHLNLNLSLP
jgi:uncharacterized protein (DUF2225 family)